MKLEYTTDQHQPYFMEIIPPWSEDLIYIIGEAAGGGDLTEFEVCLNHNQWTQAKQLKVVRRKEGETVFDHWERTVLEAHGIVYDDWLKHITQRQRNKKFEEHMSQLETIIENLERFHGTKLDIEEGTVSDDDLNKLCRALASLSEGEDLLDDVYSSHGG